MQTTENTVTVPCNSRYTQQPASVSVRVSYRQAIETRYLGPTDTKSSRVVAKCCGGRVVVSWDHALNVDQNHAAAAAVLAAKLGWTGRMVGGGNSLGTGQVFVFVAPNDILDT